MEMSDDSPTEEETQALEPSNNAKNRHKPTSDLESDLETIMNKAKAEVNSASRAIAWSAYTVLVTDHSLNIGCFD